ncbi:MAG: hypothetical protein FWE05_05985 [Defluviitaleaceae bacterium]|nr:hypothetical protein [Defluviitaleaceae bacterium]
MKNTKVCLKCHGTGFYLNLECSRCDGTGYLFSNSDNPQRHYAKTYTPRTEMHGGRYSGCGMQYDNYDDEHHPKQFEKQKYKKWITTANKRESASSECRVYDRKTGNFLRIEYAG